MMMRSCLYKSTSLQLISPIKLSSVFNSHHLSVSITKQPLVSPSPRGVWISAVVRCSIRSTSSSVGSSPPTKQVLEENEAQEIISSSSTMEVAVAENEVGEIKLLPAIHDKYDGVIVELSEPLEAEVFVSMLKASLAEWKMQGKKGVWIKVPIELANLVEPAVREGFWYHHAEPKYLMLAYWIPGGAHTLPANASHRVGVGAFVLNDKREILVVQEKSGMLRGTGVWKLPTGVVDEGEDICAAAVREVKEETAIETEFIEVLAFRQSHNSFFGKSDLFFVCMLQPLSFNIQKQELEIEAAQWMPWEDYTAQLFVQNNEFMKQLSDVCMAKKDGKYLGFSPVLTSTNFSKTKTYLYRNVIDL